MSLSVSLRVSLSFFCVFLVAGCIFVFFVYHMVTVDTRAAASSLSLCVTTLCLLPLSTLILFACVITLNRKGLNP